MGSLRLALRIERAMPCLRRVVCCTGQDGVSFDEDLGGRWMMSCGRVGGGRASTTAAVRGKEDSIDDLLKVLRHSKLLLISSTYLFNSKAVATC